MSTKQFYVMSLYCLVVHRRCICIYMDYDCFNLHMHTFFETIVSVYLERQYVSYV